MQQDSSGSNESNLVPLGNRDSPICLHTFKDLFFFHSGKPQTQELPGLTGLPQQEQLRHTRPSAAIASRFPALIHLLRETHTLQVASFVSHFQYWGCNSKLAFTLLVSILDSGIFCISVVKICQALLGCSWRGHLCLQRNILLAKLVPYRNGPCAIALHVYPCLCPSLYCKSLWNHCLTSTTFWRYTLKVLSSWKF